MRLIIDAMGGDNAPEEVLKGVFAALNETDARFILVGDKEAIKYCVKKYNADSSRFEIVHAENTITMDDDPVTVIYRKKDSSMVMALKLLAEGKGDVMMSAGNTGALFSGATLIVKRARGIKRAAIGSLLPAPKPCLLLDAGASLNVTDEYLEQFAVIGSSYMRAAYGIANPEVGILNNGTEECKGTPLQIEAGKRLRSNKSVNFIGNVEASAVMSGICDVVVCDGFTGNVFLKATEGMGKQFISVLEQAYTKKPLTRLSYLPVRDQMNRIKNRFDPSEHGGSPILGISKPVVKVHGSCDAAEFKSAVFQSIQFAENKICFDVDGTEEFL